jgi:predicted TIM-barrel fold metal-dependent hydrolase
MSDFIFGSDYPAHLENVEISYFDKGGVEYGVRLKEPN